MNSFNNTLSNNNNNNISVIFWIVFYVFCIIMLISIILCSKFCCKYRETHSLLLNGEYNPQYKPSADSKPIDINRLNMNQYKLNSPYIK